MISPIFEISDGWSWKPPSWIQAWAPLLFDPSGDSTAKRMASMAT